MAGRVLAIGLDAADEADVEARLAGGELPHLAALAARGTWCSLRVDERCRSEHPWTTFLTGLEPTTLGRWTSTAFDPATYHYANLGAVDRDPFWAVGDQAPVVALDVPACRLARDLTGVHVVDWAAHDPMYPRCSSPPQALVDIDERFGPNPALDLEYAGTWQDAQWLEAFGAALVDSVDQRRRVIEHLLTATPDWRLAVVVFSETHQLGHDAWHGLGPGSVLASAPSAAAGATAFGSVMDAIDVAIGRLVDSLDVDDTVVVFSPKGHERISDVGATTVAPELLHRLAHGRPMLHQPSPRRWARRGRPPVVPPAGMWHVGVDRAAVGRRPLARARLAARWKAFALADAVAPSLVARRRLRKRRAAAARPPWTPPDPATLATLFMDLPYDGWLVATWYRPWWPRQRWFVIPSFADVHVRINLAGREARGLVAREDYDAACAEVEDAFRACRDPRTGRPVVAAVDRPFAGDPFARPGLAADVVITWAGDLDAVEHPDVGLVGPYPAWRAGGHASRAFAVAAGAGIGTGRREGDRLVDLSATLLERAGLDPPYALDGRPIPLGGRRSTPS